MNPKLTFDLLKVLSQTTELADVLFRYLSDKGMLEPVGLQKAKQEAHLYWEDIRAQMDAMYQNADAQERMLALLQKYKGPVQ